MDYWINSRGELIELMYAALNKSIYKGGTMDFGKSISTCLTKYADFNGRASRSEYWWFFLFYALAAFAGGVVSESAGNLVAIALLLPSLAVGSRRMHDIDNSGWWQIVPIVSFIFALTEGTNGPNRFGEQPIE